MDDKQLRKTIRLLERHVSEIEEQRRVAEDALASLRRLLPPELGTRTQVKPSPEETFPGITEGVLQIIAEGNGRPVPVRTIREKFAERDWLVTSDGKDRTQTIYETLRRLHRDQNRLIKLGKEGYVLPASEAQTRKNDLLFALKAEGR